MKIQRIRHEQILEAARDVGVLVTTYRDDSGTTYFVKPAGRRFRSERGVLCAHGYQAFFDAIFAREDGAAITTSIARYRGRDDFERQRHQDLKRAIQMFPEECECVEDE